MAPSRPRWGPPAGGVDHQVGVQLGGAADGDARDVRHPGDRLGPGHQAGDRHAAADRQAVGAPGDRGDRGLQDGPAPGHGLEALVAVALAAGHLIRQGAEHAGANAAQGLEPGDHLGQLPLHLGPPAGQHEVDLAELVHPAPVPPLPQIPGVAPRARGVAFGDGDLVPVAGEQDPGGQAVEAPAHHDDVCHGPILRRGRGWPVWRGWRWCEGRVPSYSARSANAVRVRAAHPAGSNAPATAMTSPDNASSASWAGW